MFKTLAFIVFFTAGLIAISTGALVDDLTRYYTIKIKLDDTLATNDKIERLIEDHNAMLTNLQRDPNAAQRLAMVTLGIEPNTADTAFPKSKQQTLSSARQAIIAAAPVTTPETVLPVWLERIQNQKMRLMLYIAGAGLVILAMTCFAPGRGKSDEQQTG